jgi:hypothetical protein
MHLGSMSKPRKGRLSLKRNCELGVVVTPVIPALGLGSEAGGS